MTERFYCVGCKSHYELPVQEAVKKPSKGGSFRHSIVSQCPKGHKTTRICNAALYADYHNTKSAESPLTEGPIPDGPPSEPTPVPSAAKGFSSRCEVHEAEFEACGCDKDAESFEATQVVGTMSPGVNLEALTPVEGGMENGYGDSMVPKHSFLPEGSGHVIGSQSTSHNYTPMHAETFNADDMYPYYELRQVTNGTWGDVVGDWDDDQEEMALAVWEQSVNDDGPYILVYWKDTESDGTVVAGDFFLEAENVSNAQETGGRNNKAAIATAAAAIVIGLVWWKNRQE